MQFKLDRIAQSLNLDISDCVFYLRYRAATLGTNRNPSRIEGTTHVGYYELMLLVIYKMLRQSLKFREERPLNKQTEAVVLLWACSELEAYARQTADRLGKQIDDAIYSRKSEPIECTSIVIVNNWLVTYTGCDEYLALGLFERVPTLPSSPVTITTLLPETRFLTVVRSHLSLEDREKLKALEGNPNVTANPRAASKP